MNFQIIYINAAKKSFEKFSDQDQMKIDSAIDNMLLYFSGKRSNSPDIKMLKGKYQGIKRLRTGDFRILFKMEKGKMIILIIEIVKRKDAYKD